MNHHFHIPKEKWIQSLFFLAGGVNFIGIPIFSKFFTNTYLSEIDPATFSSVSLVIIMLWGLAYIALGFHYQLAPYVSAVFAVEKFFYTGVWIIWMKNNMASLQSIYSRDLLTGFFYSIYGVNDFLFGVFFLFVFIRIRIYHQE